MHERAGRAELRNAEGDGETPQPGLRSSLREIREHYEEEEVRPLKQDRRLD